MTWRHSRCCGDDGDDRDNMRRPRRPQTMETTWGPSGGYGDDVRTMGTTCGDHGGHRPWRPHGDLLGAMGTT